MWENHPTTDLLSEKVIQKNVVHQQQPTRIVDLTGMTNKHGDGKPAIICANGGIIEVELVQCVYIYYIYICIYTCVCIEYIYIHHFIPWNMTLYHGI